MVKDYTYETMVEDLSYEDGMFSLPFNTYKPVHLEILEYDKENHLHIQYIHSEKKLPLIVYVQGSAWKKQNLFNHVFELYEFAKRGYQIGIVEYRDSSTDAFPAQVEDGKKAIKYLYDHQDEYDIDGDSIYIWGDSSGGHTVTMMAATYNHEFQDFTLPPIKGVIDFYGPVDIYTMDDYPSTCDHVSPDGPEGRIIGFKNVKENKDLTEKMNICNYIFEDRDLVPVLMCHGNKDRLVPFHQSIELYQKLKACHKDVTFYKIDKGDHGGYTFWHSATLDLVEEFIKKTI